MFHTKKNNLRFEPTMLFFPIKKVLNFCLTMLLSKNSIGKSKIRNRKVPIIDFDGEKVWLGTAMVLSEARDLILLLK